ncbi:hypothetical protein DMUE_3111 [Dictyocoela muelleri]|nr:hypothetical protein DMUE_3111 [Dictyocoela muelleri]
MKIDLHNFEKAEIIEWLLTKILPTRLDSRKSQSTFKRRANLFVYDSESLEFKYRRGAENFLLFFTLEEFDNKKNFILLKHMSNRHAGRYRLNHLLKSVVYGATRFEILFIINSCEICQSRKALVTSRIIRPIIAINPRG